MLSTSNYITVKCEHILEKSVLDQGKRFSDYYIYSDLGICMNFHKAAFIIMACSKRHTEVIFVVFLSI